MKLFKRWLPLILAILLMSWYPYFPGKTLKENGVKGPVSCIIENVDNCGDRNIIVQKFDSAGKLQEIIYYFNKHIYNDSVVAHKPLISKTELDTCRFDFTRKQTFSYSKSGKLLKKQKFDETGKLFSRKIYTYNSRDSLVKVKRYDIEPGTIIEKVDYTAEFECYDKFYRKIMFDEMLDTVISDVFLNADNKRMRKITYESGFANMGVLEEFEYGTGGLVREYRQYDYDSSLNKEDLVIRLVWRYNQAGDVTLFKRYYASDLKYENAIEYFYDSGRVERIIETEKEFSGSSADTSRFEWFYDRYENPVKLVKEQYGNTQIEDYEYVYDEYGNWTSKYVVEDGESVLEEKRIIIYRE